MNTTSDPTATPPPRSRAQLLALHAVAWLLVGVVYFLGVLPFHEEAVGALAAFKVLWAAMAFGLTTAMGRVYRAVGVDRRPLSFGAPVAVGVSVVAAALWIGVLGWMILQLMGSTELFFTRVSLPFVAMNHLFILMAWSGGYLALLYWRRSQDEQTRSVAALGMARTAQLEMLRYQLNPHFLFNALASLRALIGEDPDRARDMVTRLSSFLRYTLGSGNRTRATLAQEVATVRNYLEIERVRFDDGLVVEFDEDPRAERLQVPSFLLHALVENAVKHGGHGGAPLALRIRTHASTDALTLEVENSGSLGEEGSGMRGLAALPPTSGVGLPNLVARLEAAFPGAHRFELNEVGSADDRRVRATITIDRSAL